MRYNWLSRFVQQGCIIYFKFIHFAPPILDSYFFANEIYQNEGVRTACEKLKPFVLQYCKQGKVFFHQQFIWSYFCPGGGGFKQKNKHPVVQYCTVHCSRIVDCTYLYDPPPSDNIRVQCTMYIVFLIVGLNIFFRFLPPVGVWGQTEKYISLQYSTVKHRTVLYTAVEYQTVHTFMTPHPF